MVRLAVAAVLMDERGSVPWVLAAVVVGCLGISTVGRPGSGWVGWRRGVGHHCRGWCIAHGSTWRQPNPQKPLGSLRMSG